MSLIVPAKQIVPAKRTPRVNQIQSSETKQVTFAPSSLGAAWLYSPALLTTTGSAINSAGDAGGGSIVLASAAGAEEHTATDIFGAVGVQTTNATGRLFSASGGPVGAEPFHFAGIMTAQVDGAGPYLALWTMGAPTAVSNLFVQQSGHTYQADNNSGSVSVAYPTDPVDTTNVLLPHVIELQYDGATITLWYDGRHYNPSDVTIANTISDASFGVQRWNGGFNLANTIFSSIAQLTGGVWSRTTLQSWLRSELTRLGSTGRMVAFWGDSTTAGGAGGTNPQFYLPVAVRSHQTGSNVIFAENLGVTSERSDQIYARMLPFVDPTTHWSIWWGTNDISQILPGGNPSTGIATQDAALIYAVNVEAINLGHARGVSMIDCTLQQWNIGTGTYDDQVRVAYNVLVVANAAGADAIADVSAAMGPYNSANFEADGIHPTDAANQNIISPVVYAAILASGGV